METADRLATTQPHKITRDMVKGHTHMMLHAHPERFDALEKVGFKLDRYGDPWDRVFRLFGGHFVDVGSSAKIADGRIKIKGEAVKEWTKDGLLFEDGSRVNADLVVLATGYEKDARGLARAIVGDAADQMEDFLGLNEEGELKGAFRRAGRESIAFESRGLCTDAMTDPALFYVGGDIRQCRFFSRFVALQIQASLLGADQEPYLGHGS